MENNEVKYFFHQYCATKWMTSQHQCLFCIKGCSEEFVDFVDSNRLVVKYGNKQLFSE